MIGELNIISIIPVLDIDDILAVRVEEVPVTNVADFY